MALDQGIKSKNVRSTPVKTGAGSKGISPGFVGQRGNVQGNHVTESGGKSTGYKGEPMLTGKNFQPVKFGNELALNVGKGGPGTGRTVYASGSQGTQGSVNPGKPSPSRDILGSFGPESSRGS
jgi:hypothetical protein